MKNLFFVVLMAIGFIGIQAQDERKVVDTEASVLHWTGYKVLGNHTGDLSLQDAEIAFDKDGNLTGGSFSIDMASLTVTDLEGKKAEKLAGHLHSPDFFNSEEFPIATLLITKVISRGKTGEYKIIANLIMKGITKEIKFNATTITENNQKTLKADITIDRSDFDIRYGSGSFFDSLGDNTIYDEFDVSVELVVE